MKGIFLDSRGITLIELMIVGGVIAISVLVSASVVQSSIQFQNYIGRRTEVADLKIRLLTTMGDASPCTCQLKPADPSTPGNLWFDGVSAAAGTAQKIDMVSVNSGCGAAPALAATGQKLPGSQFDTLVDKVTFENMRPVVTGDPNSADWIGEWRVSFINPAGSTPIRPISVMQRFRIDTTSPSSTAAHRLIEKCKGPASAGAPSANYFESPELTLSGGVTTTVPHGLPSKPHFVHLTAICKNPTNGYAVGEELDMTVLGDLDGNMSYVVTYDSTNVYVTPANAPGMYLTQRNGGSNLYSSFANWGFKVRAYSF